MSTKHLPCDSQANELRDAFEQCNAQKDCLAQCVAAMGGAFKRSHVSRQLKSMGLKRGRLTASQVYSSSNKGTVQQFVRWYGVYLSKRMPVVRQLACTAR